MSSSRKRPGSVNRFKTSFVAIVTPFTPAGKVDYRALSALIDWQIRQGIGGIVPCGSTGEAATLDYEEHDRVIRHTVEHVKGRVPVMAGTGSNSLAEAIEITRRARLAGADAALVVSPYYNKPTQDGIFRHFQELAANANIPIFAYNVPGRTASNILPETVARLATIPNVIGIKEACGSISQIQKLIRICPKDFIVLSGDDDMTFPLLTLGAHGTISASANVIPAQIAGICREYARGNVAKARKIHFSILDIIEGLFIETNPIAVKTALAMMGKCSAEMRLPLTPITAPNRDRLRAMLKNHKLVK